MATWITHLRVADALLDRLSVHSENFVAGSVAPDCGLPDGNGFYSYSPPKTVTHFSDRFDSPIQCERFWEEYGAGETDPARVSFYLGYYAHLVTDSHWLDTVYAGEKERFSELYNRDVIAFRNAVRADWYALDLLFVADNPEFRAWRIFRELNSFENTFLPYFRPDSIAVRTAEMTEHYSRPADRDYPFVYLTQPELESFVNSAARLVLTKIGALGTAGVIPSS